MGKIITTIAFLALIGAPAALAQAGTTAGSGSTAAPSSRITNSAPVGHRQPRAGEIPTESPKAGNPTTIDPEEAAVDRKIKNICRGC